MAKVVENHRRWGATVSDKMVELAQIRAGQKVLDIATVSVNLQLPQGKLSVKKVVFTATDISPEMLAIGQERAKSLGLQDFMEFVQSDAGSLKLQADNKFAKFFVDGD